MKCEMLLECIFVLENKSLTSVGEFWEAESRIVVGDEEYAHLQTLLRMFPPRIPVLRRTPLRNVDFAREENFVKSVDSYLGKIV